MTEEPMNRLERQGQRAVPSVDGSFADRLESRLRVEHSNLDPARGRRIGANLPRLGVAAALVVAGLVGVFIITGRDGGVPISVVDDNDAVAPVSEPETGDGSNAASVVDTATATPTATSLPVPSPASTESDRPAPPAPTITPPPEPTTIPEPTPTSIPATAVPTPTQTPVPAQTPKPLPTPTAEPVPTQTPVPVEPTPLPTATPTPGIEPAPIDLTCEVRVSDEVAGVVCSWTGPAIELAFDRFHVFRSLNGGEAEIVSRQRATAPSTYVDTPLNPGDDVTYLVQALDATGQVVGASVREVVEVPPPS